MKKKYNKKIYSIAQKANKVFRDKAGANPTEGLNVFGFFGKVLGIIINYLIAKPIHFLVYAIVGLFYKKGTHSPYLGMFGYTTVFLLVAGFISIIVKIAVM